MRTRDNDNLAELLSAYLDGALSPQEVRRLEARLRDDESARRLLEELRRTTSLVSSLPVRPAPHQLADELQARLERLDLIGDAHDQSGSRPGRWALLRTVLPAAAVLAVVVGVGSYIANDRPDRSNSTSVDLRTTPDGINALLAEQSDAIEKPDGTERLALLQRNESPASHRAMRSATRRQDRFRTKAAKDADDDHLALTQQPHVSESRARDSVSTVEESAVAFASPSETEDPRTTPDHEAIVLTMSVPNEAARRNLTDLLRSRHEAYLVKSIAASASGPAASEVSTPPSKSPSRESGATGTHASQPHTGSPADQLTLRMPVTSLAGVLSVMDEIDSRSDVALQAGPLHVQGRARVTALSGVLAGPVSPADNDSADSGTTLSENQRNESWRSMLTMLGFDAATVTSIESLMKPSSQRKGASHSDSAETRIADLEEPGESNALASAKEKQDANQPGLVSRLMHKLDRDEDEVASTSGSGEGEIKESSTAGVTNRPLTITGPPEKDEGDRLIGPPASSSDPSPGDKLITLIIRIEVVPDLGNSKSFPTALPDSGKSNRPTVTPAQRPSNASQSPSLKAKDTDGDQIMPNRNSF